MIVAVAAGADHRPYGASVDRLVLPLRTLAGILRLGILLLRREREQLGDPPDLLAKLAELGRSILLADVVEPMLLARRYQTHRSDPLDLTGLAEVHDARVGGAGGDRVD